MLGTKGWCRKGTIMPDESIQKFAQDIREQITLGKTGFALDQLQNYVDGSVPELRNEVSIQRARFTRLRRDERMGVITRDEAAAERARLENALLQFLDELPDHISIDRSPSMPAASEPSKIALPEDTALEKIIGVNNLKQISWIQRGIEVASSVCRILTPIGRGSGFLIDGERIMTNNHVISSSAVAGQSYAEFNYQADSSGTVLPSFRYRLRADGFHTSPVDKLDYSIVQVQPDSDLPALENWGRLHLDANARPFPSEHVTIIQHPSGGLKQIAITANQVVNLEESLLYYTTDTMPGSSGSPVFSDVWKVIAIHHAYGGLKKDSRGNYRYTNEGILMPSIRNDLGELWPG